MQIEQVINQRTQFVNQQVRLTVSVMYASSTLYAITNTALKEYGISVQQFNALRILRGLYPASASIKLITERMVDKMSNTSRLIDKLEQKGFVCRIEDEKDRRKVEITITTLGLDILQHASLTLETHTAEFLEQKLSLEETLLAVELLGKIIK
jgi:DNA-binding MarR family transcriptional regulator